MSDSIPVGSLYPGRMGPNALLQQQKSAESRKSANLVTAGQADFNKLLNDQILYFSNHAVKRLEQRGIDLKPEQLKQINTAIDNAAAKGAKDSLILMKDMALIVNVNNRTVVTAMDSKSMLDNVFTQIDSAVIIS